jgi:tyrosine-protein phosphatase OCA6
MGVSPPPPPPPLIPPFRFAAVEDGLLRGAHPTLRNYRFLRRLRLRTIVSLIAEDTAAADLAEFCATEDIDLVTRRAAKYDDGDVLSMTEPLVAAVLSLLLDTARHPLFLHCRDGGHNTGLVVMCLRRLQHWTNEAIHDEHRRYTKGGESHYQEEQFVEAFSGPVLVPHPIPRWLWGGARIRAHPSVKIVHAPLPEPSPPQAPLQASPPTSRQLVPPDAASATSAAGRAHRISLPSPSPPSSIASLPPLGRPGSNDSFAAVAVPASLLDAAARYQLPPSASRGGPPADLPGIGAGISGSEWEVAAGGMAGGSGGGGGGVGGGAAGRVGGVTTGAARSPVDSADGQDDYQSWPGVTASTPYSLELAGLALAGLELAPQPSSAKVAAAARVAAASKAAAAAAVVAARLADS